MTFGTWSAFVGLLLIFMALGNSLLARLPLSTSIVYLVAGVGISPLVLGWTQVSLASNARSLEILAEVVVLLSLFTSGLKMSLPLGDERWRLPLRLALGSMVITVALVAVAGALWLGLSLGAAILLGAILAPTDPVLASEVQIARPGDRDRVRFALTGEAGLNDGTAFPFVMLGLGLLGLHELGAMGWRWLAIDVLWAVAAGLGVGAGLGTLVARLVLHLRRAHREAVGLDNFLALGLVGLAYGVALLVHAYGFLAVFAAGVAFRREEQRASPDADAGKSVAVVFADPNVSNDELAVDPKQAPAFMAHAVLSFNEQMERIGEVAAVVAVGMLLWAIEWKFASVAFIGALLLVIRPLSVAVGLARSPTLRPQRIMIGWFGIRGIGSLYYLMYAINHGLDPQLATRFAAIVFSVIVVSIVVHGVSVTPLAALYDRARRVKSTLRK